MTAMTDFHTGGAPSGLLGSTVRIDIPRRRKYERGVGTVTGLGLPLVQVEVDGRPHYRHIDDLSLQDDVT